MHLMTENLQKFADYNKRGDKLEGESEALKNDIIAFHVSIISRRKSTDTRLR